MSVSINFKSIFFKVSLDVLVLMWITTINFKFLIKKKMTNISKS